MRNFKWIAWNLDKIADHHLTRDEVEAAFDRVYQLDERDDGSFVMVAEAPSGRTIRVIWRYDTGTTLDPFAHLDDDLHIFVITAY